MSRRTQIAAGAVVLLTFIAIVCVAYGFYAYAKQYPDKPISESRKEITVTVPTGATLNRVATLLLEAGVIKSRFSFRMYANYRGLASKIRAGTFPLHTQMTPKALLELLVKGVPAPQVTVTIPEGKNMLEIAKLYSDAKISKYDSMLKAMRDRRLLRRLDVPSDTIDGFLYPDTYKFREGTPAVEVLERMVRRHKAVYVRLRRKYAAATKRLRKKLGWGHREIVTMASIVEKETGQPKERPLIAGLFLNRLRFGSFQPKLLQTDPTIIYGCTVPEEKSAACKKFEGRIRTIHLRDKDNPYNTYTHVGLPPGPISNPGKAAMEAVFNPTSSRYLYFVSRNDGTHKFSKTVAEHERAVDKYQRGK